MTNIKMSTAINTWRSTYIGYNLEDMTKWWVVAKWFDERELLTSEELEADAEHADITKPWWSPYAFCFNIQDSKVFGEVLHDDVMAFDNYKECVQYAMEINGHNSMVPGQAEYMPLNVGDYIRWGEYQIDGGTGRGVGLPRYKASQRFFEAKPT